MVIARLVLARSTVMKSVNAVTPFAQSVSMVDVEMKTALYTTKNREFFMDEMFVVKNIKTL